MLNRLWHFCGASTIGPFHIKNKIVNQDYLLKRSYKWGNIVVVSDGLGSQPHSDYGSKAACFAVVEAAKELHKNPKAKIVDILRLIHSNWLVKISPYSAKECAATCLFVIQINKMLIVGRLGDGIIIALDKNNKENLLLTDDKNNSFSNLTACLQEEFKPHQWEAMALNSGIYDRILLCTDGISDDLMSDKQIEFAQEIFSTYWNLESKKINKDLKRWLNKWPVPNHSDDKTIGCLYKKGASYDSSI